MYTLTSKEEKYANVKKVFRFIEFLEQIKWASVKIISYKKKNEFRELILPLHHRKKRVRFRLMVKSYRCFRSIQISDLY